MNTINEQRKRKGHWKVASDGDGIVCSECGTDFCIMVIATENFNYCPYCGAKMEQEAEE